MDTTKEELKRYKSENLDAPQTPVRGLLTLGNVAVDMSKSGVSAELLDMYAGILKKPENQQFIHALLSGGIVNVTEQRPSMQACVRAAIVERENGAAVADLAGLNKAKAWAHAASRGELVGETGKPITSIIHMGIGGSYLGPALLSDFFSLSETEQMSVHYVSTHDGVALRQAFDDCDPESTLCVVVSKSFSTWETLENGALAREWLVNALGREAAANHLLAVTAEREKAVQWGVAEGNVLTFPDGLGGRFSLWSAVSVSVVLQFGWAAFCEFVRGGSIVDEHVKDLEQYSPLTGLLAFQNSNVHMHEYTSVSVSAYNSMLRKVTPWLQQLEMESNGKVWRKNGEVLYEAVSPVVFGQHGTDCQHAYFQMVHQGSEVVPVELIGVVDSSYPEQSRYQLANMIAQARTFANGAGKDGGMADYRVLEGGRPCVAIVLQDAGTASLGTLLALYEYRTILHGHLSGVNSFDQFGVEHGKKHVQPVLVELRGEEPSEAPLVNLLRDLL